MRTLLLSNVNMQPIVSFLKPWEVVCGEYNSILIDLSNPAFLQPTRPIFTQVLCLFRQRYHDVRRFLWRWPSRAVEAISERA